MVIVDVFSVQPVQGYSWPHRIESVLTADGSPVTGSKRVAVMDREKMTVIAAVVSDPDGSFLFRGLPQLPVGHTGFTLIAHDNVVAGEPVDGTYNATVMDMVMPSMGA